MKSEHVAIFIDKPDFIAYRKARTFGNMTSAVVFLPKKYTGRRVLVIVPREDYPRNYSHGGEDDE